MSASAPATPDAATGFTPGLLARLPAVRGRLRANAPLAHMTWLRVGGPAEGLFKPADAQDLADFLAACPADVSVTPLGVASNLLIRDGGIPGVVVRLGRAFSDIQVADSKQGTIHAGALALDLNIAKLAAAEGIGGLAFLAGIPGTLGGGLRMNAGAYGREIKDVLIGADLLDRQGNRHVLGPDELGLAYRHSDVPADWLFVGATLQGEPGQDPVDLQQDLDAIQDRRAATQPIREATGGSTFANPPGDSAWRLIEAAGCRGLTRGGAAVSSKHANFLINTGGANAAELEGLAEDVRARVRAATGVALRWELRRVGVPASDGEEA